MTELKAQLIPSQSCLPVAVSSCAVRQVLLLLARSHSWVQIETAAAGVQQQHLRGWSCRGGGGSERVLQWLGGVGRT